MPRFNASAAQAILHLPPRLSSPGYPPFFDDNPFCIYEKILGGKLEFPQHMEAAPRDLVKRLLVQDRTKRLGNMKAGAEDIKKHRSVNHTKLVILRGFHIFPLLVLRITIIPRWFKQVDWEEVYQKQLKPPIVPVVEFEGDTSNFDNYPEEAWRAGEPLSARQMAMFEDF